MSLIAAKYLNESGWILFKNLDSNERSDLKIRKSFKGDLEKIYIIEEKTKATEGLNEHGIGCIGFEAEPFTPEMETELFKIAQRSSTIQKMPRLFHCPTGIRIRKAFSETTPKAFIDKLIELQITGSYFVADAKECLAFDSAFVKTNIEGEEQFLFKISPISRNQVAVRESSSHGEIEPKSSESAKIPRLQNTKRNFEHTSDLEEFLFAGSEAPAMIPDDGSGTKIKTIAQEIILPASMVVKLKTYWVNAIYDASIVNDGKKLKFEISSKQKIMSFKEHLQVSTQRSGVSKYLVDSNDPLKSGEWDTSLLPENFEFIIKR